MKRTALCCLLFCVAVYSGPLFACATCLCGDPTITMMGTEKPFDGRLRGSVEWLQRGETMGQAGIDKHEIDEERVTVGVNYSINERWILAFSLPLITHKEVRRFDTSRETASGIGDADLYARWYIGNTQRHLWGMHFGVRIPTSTEETSNGEAINFDAQPGAGTVIPSIGAWYSHFNSPVFFYTSAVYQRAVDTGYQGYESGDGLLLTGHAQYAWAHTIALSFSLDGRWKERDAYFGEINENSGGLLVMATPGISWTPMTDLILYASYQIPAIDGLYGHQEEKPNLRIGVTYDF